MPVCYVCNMFDFTDVHKCPHCGINICENCIERFEFFCPECGTYLWRTCKIR